MPLKRFRCPKCQGELEIDLTPAIEAVQCGHCEAVLPIRRSTAAAAAAPPPPPPVKPPVQVAAEADEVEDPPRLAEDEPSDEEVEDTAPAKKPKKKRKPKPPPPPTIGARIAALPKPALAGAGAGAVALLGLIAWLAFRGGGDAPAAARPDNRAAAVGQAAAPLPAAAPEPPALAANVADLVAADLAAIKAGGVGADLDSADWKVDAVGPSVHARLPDKVMSRQSSLARTFSTAKEHFQLSYPEATGGAPNPDGTPQMTFFQDTVDLATGQRGVRRDLAKCLNAAQRSGAIGFDLVSAAPDGTLLLESDKEQLRLLDPGAAEPRVVEILKWSGTGIRVHQSGQVLWSAGSKLWCRSGQRLELVDPKAGKVLFTSAESAPGDWAGWGLWAMTPNGKALVAVDPKFRLRIFDAEIGGELGNWGIDGWAPNMLDTKQRWGALTPSPDGARLVACRYTPNSESRAYDARLHFWSLKTGAYEGELNLAHSDEAPHYWFNGYFVYHQVLIDPETRTPLGRLIFEADQTPAPVNARGRYQDRDYPTRDGRLLQRTKADDVTVWQAAALPKLERVPILKPGDALAVAVQMGDPTLDRRAAAVLEEVVRQAGFKLAPGGWTLRMNAKPAGSAGMLKFTGGKEIPAAAVGAELALVSPQGQAAYTTLHGVGFVQLRSKYHVGTDRSKVFETVDNYRFPGDPTTLMREETWTAFVRSLARVPWPRTLFAGADPGALPKLVVKVPELR